MAPTGYEKVRKFRMSQNYGVRINGRTPPNDSCSSDRERQKNQDLHHVEHPRVLGKYALGDSELSQGTYHGHIDEHMSWLLRRKFLVNEFGFWDFGDGRGAAGSDYRLNNEFGISYAMLFHYLRTGDVRFFEEGVAFAMHFRDVDTLHFGEMKGKSIRHTDNHVKGGSG